MGSIKNEFIVAAQEQAIENKSGQSRLNVHALDIAHAYKQSCPCDEAALHAGRNGAHFLHEWMIRNGLSEPGAGGLSEGRYCAHGRMLAALEIRTHIYREDFGLKMNKNPPLDGNYCFIYCQRTAACPQPAAVYYGNDKVCIAGTQTFPTYEYREYWY